MPKVMKGIRADQEVFDAIDTYNELRRRCGMSKVPIGDYVSDACRRALAQDLPKIQQRLAGFAEEVERLKNEIGSV